MTSFDIAHVREQGQDMIIVPMRADFGHKATDDQVLIERSLSAAARAAGLAGLVVTVWDAGFGRMAFRGPPQWHPFLASISLHWVARNINRRVTVG
jgi:hypothetical protein